MTFDIEIGDICTTLFLFNSDILIFTTVIPSSNNIFNDTVLFSESKVVINEVVSVKPKLIAILLAAVSISEINGTVICDVSSTIVLKLTFAGVVTGADALRVVSLVCVASLTASYDSSSVIVSL